MCASASPAQVVIAAVAYAFISLFFQSILKSAIMLMQPWGVDAPDLPCEEHLLMCLVAHKELYRTITSPAMPAAYRRGADACLGAQDDGGEFDPASAPLLLAIPRV